ncbi:tetratricopeptide repeat protein [Fluviispira multicolorata]|uniref:Tetratricopeptide repeat protein n=1 Tax=Fluviispira multicolorata TaxID=2654512 RepID=A0A833JFU4_9BACT|nr:tetratricopeptide repeat protein [Fluviispira multicolorata]KAB8031796.1 tetratricopeptide repeat protein [Fluviispira multicolorata]
MASTVIELSPDMSFLVVDDAPASRETIVKTLKTLGFKKVSEGISEGEALKLLQEKVFDFVICEKDMRQLGGYEFLMEMHENLEIKRVPFMIVGTEQSKEDRVRFPEANPDGFLKMPFVMKDLSTQISQTLMRYREGENIEVDYEIARDLYMNGEYEQALGWYKNISMKNLTSARAFVGISRCNRALGNSEEAVKNLKFAMQNNKNHVQAYIEYGICLLATDQKQAALKAFDQALLVNPKNPMRYEEAANILTRCELYEEAENFLMRAVNMKIVYPKLYAQVGRNFLSQKKKDKALDFLQRANEQDPNNPSFLNSIGICYKEMGKFEESVNYYNLALKINPNDVKIMFNKVLCLITMREYERAKKVCHSILKVDPKFERVQQKIVEIDKLASEQTVEIKYRGVIPK